MAWPTANEIREFLKGYSISSNTISDLWITSRLNNMVIPFIEQVAKMSFTAETEYTEYISGTGASTIMLSRKPVNSIVSAAYVAGNDIDASIGLSGLQLLANEGIIKVVQVITEGGYNTKWRKGDKNIKIVYKAGYDSVPSTIKEAAIYLSSEQILGYIGARTGGGSISVQGFSRSFGNRGRYQDIRNDLNRQAMFLLRKYKTGVVAR